MKCIIIVFSLLLISVTKICAQNESSSSYEGRGIIPGWVKSKTTSDEYKVWETLSQYYCIDYSPLKSRSLIGKKRDDIYNRLRVIGESLHSGKQKIAKNEKFSITYMTPDTALTYCTEVIESIEKKNLIYTSMDGYDAHIGLNLIYNIDKKTGTPNILKYTIGGISFSGLKVEVEEQKSEGDLSKYDSYFCYIPEIKLFKGYYSGVLHFTDAIGVEHKEFVSVNFYIAP